eukprot:gene3167-6881_t
MPWYSGDIPGQRCAFGDCDECGWEFFAMPFICTKLRMCGNTTKLTVKKYVQEVEDGFTLTEPLDTVLGAVTFLEEFAEEAAEYAQHHFAALHCVHEFMACQEYLLPKHVCLQMDFASKVHHEPQAGVPEQLYAVAMNSMLPMVVQWRSKSGERLRSHGHVVVSDDKLQDVAHVRSALQMLKKNGVFAGFDYLDIWSDGGPHHFKNKAAFNATATADLDLDMKLVRHAYHAADHRRGMCDRLGAIASTEGKEAVNRMESNGEMPFKNGLEFVGHLNRYRNKTRYSCLDAKYPLDEIFYHYLPGSENEEVRAEMPDVEDLRGLKGSRRGLNDTCSTGQESHVGWRLLPCCSCKACRELRFED